MPLIYRTSFDMFEISETVNYMVNLVNLQGKTSGGINGEFRKRVPHYADVYEAACKSNELRMGTVQVIEDTGASWGMINLPTKRQLMDQTSKEDAVRTLEALREFLLLDKNRYCSLVLPMFNCGDFETSYSTMLPLMDDYLADLDATIFLSLSPDRTTIKPKYLTIAGPLDYGRDDTEKAMIEKVIEQVLTAWGTNISDYTGVVSGGYQGVDAYVCGSHFGKIADPGSHDVGYPESYVWRKTERMPLVCKPNKARDGLGSNLHLGNLLCEIGDDIILFKPKGHNNNRLSAMQTWLQANDEQRVRDGLIPKRAAVFGDKDSTAIAENLIVPILEKDLPY